MDFSQDRPIGETIGMTPDYSDISTEDIRAILADEITVEEIYERRAAAEREARMEELITAKMIEYEDIKTRYLLAQYRRERSFSYRGYYYYDSSYSSYPSEADIREIAMKRVLDSREHVPTRNKIEGKAARRAAAQMHHGGRKNKTR